MELFYRKFLLSILFILAGLVSCTDDSDDIVVIFLAGDSTVADYAQYDNYLSERFPVTGWGQVFQQYFRKDSLKALAGLISSDSVRVDDRAVGGRSTRTFFQEGRWRSIYNDLKPGDLVLIQFGHNDASVRKTERYVNVEGYKEFLRLFIHQTRQKGGIPVLITPVNRNYPWEDGVLHSSHGEYAEAVREVAAEKNTLLIDLTRLSCECFTATGRDYVTEKYFMNLAPGIFEAYPEGQNDNTHFQPEGATVVAGLVYEAMKEFASGPEQPDPVQPQ